MQCSGGGVLYKLGATELLFKGKTFINIGLGKLSSIGALKPLPMQLSCVATHWLRIPA